MQAPGFIRQRGLSLALVIVVMAGSALSQGSISYTFAFGALGMPLGLSLKGLTEAAYFARWCLLGAMAVMWALGRKRILAVLIIIVNVIATLALLLHTSFLLRVLSGLSARTVDEILADVVLMGVSNILIFSIWYWIIDPPGIEGDYPPGQPWAFLFPQRGGDLPLFESWQPNYLDYLFVAFTTSFAFSPTDAAPLTRTAKMLMLLQAAISVITLTGVASSAINILAGNAAKP
jgi:hypothetical protein